VNALALVGIVLAAAPSSDLVEITALDATVRLDVRYATADNFLGRPLYPVARGFLRRPVAEALVRVHRALEPRGYGLVVFDAYRPWSVTKLMWELTPPGQRGFVANPARGSNHNRGCAVDLTLFARDTGLTVEMPSPYDEMSPRSAAAYAGGSPEPRARRDRLRAAMEEQGFQVERHEWWHFNHRTCPGYEVLDLPLESLPTSRASR
jgi:zinc D-Ala-D-Ala dipeptidase